jgi:hypothetical protein
MHPVGDFILDSIVSSLTTTIEFRVTGLTSNQNSPMPKSLYFTNNTSAKL